MKFLKLVFAGGVGEKSLRAILDLAIKELNAAFINLKW